MSDFGDPANQPPASSEAVNFGVGATQPPPPDGSVFPPPQQPRKRGLAVGIAAGAVALAVVAGGAVWAVSSFMSGGGSQPESMVPANAIGFVGVDFDPAAGQKVAAYRFLQKFPSVGSGSGEGDLMGQIVGSALKADPSAGVDYERDVKPWIGKRVGFAAVPAAAGAADKEPQALLVIQVTDEDKARTSLRTILDKAKADEASSFSAPAAGGGVEIAPSTSPTSALLAGTVEPDEAPEGLVVRDGWALIGQDQAATEAMSAEAEKADLGGSATFNDDLDRIAKDGVLSAWVDLSAVKKAAEAEGTGGEELLAGIAPIGGLDAVQGRFVAGLRFDGNTVVLDARQLGGKPSTIGNDHPGGPLLAKLPADSTAGLAVGNASDTIAEMYQQLIGSAGGALVREQVRQSTGLTLPTDLQALLGSAFVVSVGDVRAASPQVAVRVQTDDPAGARKVFDTVAGLLESEQDSLLPVPQPIALPAPGGLVYAVSPGYGALVAKDGTLGESASFKAALPDAATAGTAMYVDLAKVAAQLPADEGGEDFGPLVAFGMTSSTQAGEQTMTVRLVAK